MRSIFDILELSDAVRRVVESSGAYYIACASAGNTSPMPRANVFVVFNRVENAVQAPFAGSAPRPSFLARRPE